MTVWITRSEPGAGRLVAALAAAGLDARSSPALEIVDIEPRMVEISGKREEIPEICIAVSQHAATRYVQSAWLQSGVQHIGIGAVTAEALRERIPDAKLTVPAEPTTEGLLGMSQLSGAEQVIWIVAGTGGREDLGAALAARGHRVCKLELYERRGAGMENFQPQPGDVVEAGSEAALETLTEWFAGNSSRQAGLTFVVPSKRLFAAAQARKFYNTQIARSAEIADVVVAASTAAEQ